MLVKCEQCDGRGLDWGSVCLSCGGSGEVCGSCGFAVIDDESECSKGECDGE